jgi:hypothetical protein
VKNNQWYLKSKRRKAKFHGTKIESERKFRITLSREIEEINGDLSSKSSLE